MHTPEKERLFLVTMTFENIRPVVEPMPFSDALADVPVLRWIDADQPAQDTLVSGVTVSSRDCAQGWVFVAIPGMVRHGIAFAGAAIREGCVAVITDEAGAAELAAQGERIAVAVVEDPRAAGAIVSRNVYRRAAEKLVTMAITGTNGKTTTSYLMRAALQARFPHPLLSGTVETIADTFRFRSDQTTAEAPIIHRLLAFAAQQGLGGAVVETSSHALSLNRVDGIVFDVVGFTNLQHDHLDFYGTMDEYFKAKALLFSPDHSKKGVVCVDDEWGQKLARSAGVPVVTVAALTDTPADWHVHDIHPDMSIGCMVFTLVSPAGENHRVLMPIMGEVNVQNTAVAIVCAVEAGIDIADVLKAVENAEQIPGRMEKINPTPHNQPLVIVDYAHTPEALEWTLRSTRALTPGKLHIVFGCDGDRDPFKRPIMARIAAEQADVLWVTDENPHTEDAQSIRDAILDGAREIRPDLSNVNEVKTCRRDAVRRAILTAEPGDTVIITGKGAEWYQDIDGIKHEYNDAPVSREVLRWDVRTQM